MTLNQYLEKYNYSQELRDLILILANKTETIKNEFLGGDAKTGVYNIYGEEEIKIDQKANEIFLKACLDSELVKEVGSEEEKEIIKMDSKKGHFGVTLDPLDGSSLILTNLAVGTIFSIYENGDIMSGLRNISQSFYILFGPLSLMVFADKNGTAQFVCNKKNVFDLVRENIKMPEGKIYSPGALRSDWTKEHFNYINYLEKEGYKLRYSGSFVPDFHQILTYGERSKLTGSTSSREPT